MNRHYELAVRLAKRGERLGFETLSMAGHVVVQVALGIELIEWESGFIDFFLCEPGVDAGAVAGALEIIGHRKAASIFRHARRLNAVHDYLAMDILMMALFDMMPGIEDCLMAYELKHGIRRRKRRVKMLKCGRSVLRRSEEPN